MMAFLAWAAGLAGMEAVAWASHRWLMHGPMWFLHASHHRPYAGGLQANDAFGIMFALPAIALIAAGYRDRPALLGLGLGMATYGFLYLLFHDALVHGRFGRMPAPRSAYVTRLIRAHRLHHACRTRDGARHFGFLWAPKDSRA